MLLSHVRSKAGQLRTRFLDHSWVLTCLIHCLGEMNRSPMWFLIRGWLLFVYRMEEQVQENKIIRGVKARACLPPSIPYPVVKSCVLAGPIQGRVWLHSHYLEQNCLSNGALLCCIYKWSITDGNSSP